MEALLRADRSPPPTRGRGLRRAVARLAWRLAGVAVVVALGCGRAGPESPAPLRNLVLVSLDTLRADHLGSYGHARPTSPRLDAWAEGALVFERAHSLSNETISSHRALFQSNLPSLALQPGSPPTLAAILRAQGFRTAAFTDGGPMSPRFGFARGFQRFDYENEGLAETLPKALAWLDDVARGEAPFYLFLHCFDVHAPYDPGEPWDSRFSPGYAGAIHGDDTRDLLRGVRGIFEHAGEGPGRDVAAEDRRRVEALYEGEIAKTDDLLGRLLERLDEADLASSTLVVVLSDHGEEFWDHGSVLHAHTLYEELLHVPLLIRAPGWPTGRIGQRVSLLDVVPTVLELLGRPAPGGLRGRSLAPLVSGEERAMRPVLSEGLAFGTELRSVIDGRLKLIRRAHEPGAPTELYDLDADPAETRDLARERPADRERLLELMRRSFAAPAAPAPRPFEDLEDADDATRERLRALGYLE